MQERMNVIKKYLEYYPNDYTAKNELMLCEYCMELGYDLADKKGYYPRLKNESMCMYVNDFLSVTKKCHITNSKTNYKHNGVDSVVVWELFCGRLEFVSMEYYDAIDNAWEELMETLKSYNPLDYDLMNDKFIFDLENGKKLINDYDKIMNDFREKIKQEVALAKLEKKKKEIEELQNEINEYSRG